MGKNINLEPITHSFINDGSPYDKCRVCDHFRYEGGRQYCYKFDKFSPTLAFGCYKTKTKSK